MNYQINVFKAFSIILLAMAISIPATAQDDDKKMATLLGGDNGHITHGGWGGLTFGYTQINGQDTYLMGARGGWMINHRMTIGLAGSGFISDRQYYGIVEDMAVNLAGGYGGLFLEATIWPFSPVHITIPLIIGAGGVAYTDQQWWDDQYDYNNYQSIDSDAYFVLEPGLEVEINLIKFMRVGIGGSYRYTSNVSMINSSSTMMRGFTGNFSLKFGSF